MKHTQKKSRFRRATAWVIAFVLAAALCPVSLKAEGNDAEDPAKENETERQTAEYTVTYAAIGKGTVEGDEKAAAGQKIKLKAMPEEGWKLVGITADFDGFALNADNAFIMPDKNVTVTAEFAEIIKTQFTLLAPQCSGGKITPSFRTVEEGGSCLFVINADEGYELKNVFVDGVGIGPIPFYIFENVGASHLLTAEFTKKETVKETFEVKFVDHDGSLLAVRTVESGSAAQAPADPAREGYKFRGWDGDFSSVTKDMTVVARYEAEKEPPKEEEPPKKDETAEETPKPTEKLLLRIDGSEKAYEIRAEVRELGDTVRLKAIPYPEKEAKGVEWTSSDKNVAIVSSDGTVAVIGTGSAEITASFEGKTATYAVICLKEITVPNPETGDD